MSNRQQQEQQQRLQRRRRRHQQLKQQYQLHLNVMGAPTLLSTTTSLIWALVEVVVVVLLFYPLAIQSLVALPKNHHSLFIHRHHHSYHHNRLEYRFHPHQRSLEFVGALHAAGKGFGSASESAPPNKIKKNKKITRDDNNNNNDTASSSTTSFAQAPSIPVAPSPAAPITTTPTPTAPGTTQNAGQRALAELRRKEAERKATELAKLQQLQQADAQVRDSPAVIPEKVAQRMGTRMITLVGLPWIFGLAAFVAFWYLVTYKQYEFPPGLVATTTLALLASSLLVSPYLDFNIHMYFFRLPGCIYKLHGQYLEGLLP